MRAVVRDCLGVSEGEELLIVANPATQGLGEALRAEGSGAGADAVLALMEERATHAAEPPASIAAAMAAADVVLAPTVQSLSHTASRKAASEAGARIATLPGVTEEMLARVMSADMGELRRKGDAVAKLLDDADEARIVCANGSDLEFDLSGRTAIPDAGDITAAGAFGNLPCGEGFISPLSADGTLVVDGSMAGIGNVSAPVTLTISGGNLTDASGDDGAELLRQLAAGGDGGRNVAELGIGTNEKAILTGNILEDEKILGTAHVAFGASAAIGGNVQVPVHTDVLVMAPTVTVGGTTVVDEGTFVL